MDSLKSKQRVQFETYSLQRIGLVSLGCFIAIYLLSFLTDRFSVALISGSFGSSAVLIFCFPEAPFSHPKNVIGGHFLCSLVALCCLNYFGLSAVSVAFAVGVSVAVMMLTKTVHPPAGSDPVIIYLLHSKWDFILFPTLFGSIGLVLVALLYINKVSKIKYPKQWSR